MHRDSSELAAGQTQEQIASGKRGPDPPSLDGCDTKFEAWEEGSALKEYTYRITGGTGKYQDASGGGTYVYENLTDTLAGGTYKGQIVLP